jgi:hypothetical protein
MDRSRQTTPTTGRRFVADYDEISEATRCRQRTLSSFLASHFRVSRLHRLGRDLPSRRSGELMPIGPDATRSRWVLGDLSQFFHQRAWTCSLLLLVLLLSSSLQIDRVSAGELENRAKIWDSQAFRCNTGAIAFPSKYASSGPDHCDDGDMTLFNGLMCAAGEQDGCVAVKLSQGNDGRWWRSPRRIGWEAPKNDVSFSPDQALGVLAYVIHTRDADSFDRWIQWISSHRPCLVTIGNNCVLKGWPRYCTDDQSDKRCTFRPADCALLERVGSALGKDASICREILKEVNGADEIILPAEVFSVGSALLNDKGFPLHLAAVQVFILQSLNDQSSLVKLAATNISGRQPRNPFFAYLSEGKTSHVRDLTLSECPSAQSPLTDRSQWAWERADDEEAWRKSMYWDCLFIANLLK